MGKYKSFVVPKEYAEIDATHMAKSFLPPSIVFSQSPTNEEIARCEVTRDYLVTFVNSPQDIDKLTNTGGRLKKSDNHFVVPFEGSSLEDAKECFLNEFDRWWGRGKS